MAHWINCIFLLNQNLARIIFQCIDYFKLALKLIIRLRRLIIIEGEQFVTCSTIFLIHKNIITK